MPDPDTVLDSDSLRDLWSRIQTSPNVRKIRKRMTESVSLPNQTTEETPVDSQESQRAEVSWTFDFTKKGIGTKAGI